MTKYEKETTFNKCINFYSEATKHKLTNHDKKQIIQLRSQHYSYSEISAILYIPRSTVASFINSRNSNNSCLYCCARIVSKKGRGRHHVFCSDKCRKSYWLLHGSHIITNFSICLNCNQPFTYHTNRKRVFCSSSCYKAYRSKNHDGD